MHTNRIFGEGWWCKLAFSLLLSKAKKNVIILIVTWKKKEEKELGVGAHITDCLLTKPSWLFAPFLTVKWLSLLQFYYYWL